MTVYANGLEVACKAQANKVIAAFPDVCFTPPGESGHTPWRSSSLSFFWLRQGTDKGTGTVKIAVNDYAEKQVLLRKIPGTEAGRAAKKGIINRRTPARNMPSPGPGV